MELADQHSSRTNLTFLEKLVATDSPWKNSFFAICDVGSAQHHRRFSSIYGLRIMGSLPVLAKDNERTHIKLEISLLLDLFDNCPTQRCTYDKFIYSNKHARVQVSNFCISNVFLFSSIYFLYIYKILFLTCFMFYFCLISV